MKNFFNAIKVGWFYYCNPHVYNLTLLKLVDDIFKGAKQAAEENVPRVLHIASVDIKTGKPFEFIPIIEVWLGVGEGATPFKRIRELRDLNKFLQEQLSEQIKKNNVT